MSDLARRATGAPPAVPAPPASPPAPPAPPPVRPPTTAAPPPASPPTAESAATASAATPLDPEPPELLFAQLQRFVAGVRDAVVAGEGLRWDTLESLVTRAARSVTTSADLFWIANDPAMAREGDRLAAHQARVAVLALRLASAVGYDAEALVTLGMAGCLIDVGLWQLPDRVAGGRADLAVEERAQYESHPARSAALVQRWGAPSRALVDAIVQHHERDRGQGFPHGLAGAAIAPAAKVLGLADTYATLTAPPPPTPRLRAHEAVRDIVKSRGDEFPAALIKALLTEVSVFPPGTLVRLNTEETGRVTAVNRSHPLRPRIEVIADTRGRPLPAPRAIDLSESPFVYITGAVSEAGR